MEKKLSVIIPVYNGADRIVHCLESVLKQTYSNMELLIYDDGSKDNSFSVVRDVTDRYKDNGIQIHVEQQENHGVAYTRNRGISQASGDYVTFIDQDDVIAPDYCEQYMKQVQKEEYDIVVGGYERITDSGEVKRRVQLRGCKWEQYIVVSPWAHFYRRQFLSDHQIQFLSTGIGEDVYFNLLAYAATEKIKVISDTGYKWVYNEDSVSNSKQNTINKKVDPIYLLDRIWQDVSNKDFFKQDFVEYYFARYACWYMLFSFRGSAKEDIETMALSLREWLVTHFPGYRRNKYLLFRRPKGETIQISIIVRGYYMMERCKLIVPFMKCFGR